MTGGLESALSKEMVENKDLMGLQEAFEVFSKASETLQNSYADLQLETRRLSQELAAANEELQRAQRLQAMGEMAIQLAHEIRNPLGSIELFAALLSRELHDRSDQKGWADQIVTGVKFLNTIVTNMLSFTKVSPPKFVRFDLQQMISETLGFLEPVCVQRNIHVRSNESPESILIDGDKEMLRQMLINLLMNGLQAMREGGTLQVRASSDERSVEIEVHDTGVGIPKENLDRIFDPFFTTNEKGTGLGLSLVHQIIEKHNGTIAVQSQFGSGTRFRITLPAQQFQEAGC
jgi:signal transduction histidine kinase